MNASVDLLLTDKNGKEILRRWKTVAFDSEQRVFMTTFGEEIGIREGDVLIGEFHFQLENDDGAR